MNILDEAQLKTELRATYRDLGAFESICCVYQMLATAALLLEVIYEETKKEKDLDA